MFVITKNHFFLIVYKSYFEWRWPDNTNIKDIYIFNVFYFHFKYHLLIETDRFDIFKILWSSGLSEGGIVGGSTTLVTVIVVYLLIFGILAAAGGFCLGILALDWGFSVWALLFPLAAWGCWGRGGPAEDLYGVTGVRGDCWGWDILTTFCGGSLGWALALCLEFCCEVFCSPAEEGFAGCLIFWAR